MRNYSSYLAQMHSFLGLISEILKIVIFQISASINLEIIQQ